MISWPLVLAVNHLAAPPGSEASSPQSTTPGLYTFPSLEPGLVLGVLGVAATVVVAITFGQRPADRHSLDAVEQARSRLRFALASSAIAIAVTALTVVFAVAYISDERLEASPSSRLAVAVVVFALGQAITFAATHAPILRDDSAMVEAHDLPKIQALHQHLDLDLQIRWYGGNNPDPRQRPSAGRIFLALCTLHIATVLTMGVMIMVIGSMYPNETDVSVLAGSTVLLGLSLCIGPAFFMQVAVDSFQRWMWLLSHRLALALLVVTGAGAVALAVSFPDDAMVAALMWAGAAFLLWPFAVWCYPRNRVARALVIASGWPVHVLRQHALYEGHRKRHRALARSQEEARRLRNATGRKPGARGLLPTQMRRHASPAWSRGRRHRSHPS